MMFSPGPTLGHNSRAGSMSALPPVSAACGPLTDRGEFVPADDAKAIFQVSPDELPKIDIHSP